MSETDQQLAALEARIARLERAFTKYLSRARSASEAPAARRPVVEPPASSPTPEAPAPVGLVKVVQEKHATSSSVVSAQARGRVHHRVADDSGPVATQILGWSGAAALVLAAAYLVALGIDSGWLTPVRQITMAALLGIGLVVAGYCLLNARPRYASLLPAAGVVILFLAIFGAHIHYGLIDTPFATACLASVCALTLVLGRMFDNDWYALFAVVGAYATPALMPDWRTDLSDLLVYFSAWSVVFCAYSLWQGRRHTYVVAMYLAVVGFDLVWRTAGQPHWETAAVYQFVQFLIFAATAVLYSVRHDAPMSREQAWAHLPALLAFYAIEYTLLDSHASEWAPWVALASVVVTLVLYGFARARLDERTEAGATLVSGYASVVLVHAAYFELVPWGWRPWLALGVTVVVGVHAAGVVHKQWMVPVLVAVVGIFALNYLKLLTNFQVGSVPGVGALAFLYAITLYVGYGLIGRDSPIAAARVPLLYAGHIITMALVFKVVDDSFMVSIFWGLLAIGSLFLALSMNDKSLGQSSLLIFVVSGLKVLVFDLSGSAALVRVATLLVLGVTLYAGGWLYQKLASQSDRRNVASAAGTA